MTNDVSDPGPNCQVSPTYLVEAKPNNQKTNNRMEVILKRSLPLLDRRTRLDEVDNTAQEHLQEVQNENGKTPPLVVVVERLNVFHINCREPKRHTTDDNRTGYRKDTSESREQWHANVSGWNADNTYQVQVG